MTVITKYLTQLGAPIPGRLTAAVDRRAEVYAILSADRDALAEVRLGVLRGAEPEALADLVHAAAREADLRTRSLALWQEVAPTLDYAETQAERELGDEITDTVQPIFAGLVERLAGVVDVLGAEIDGAVAARTPAGARALADWQETSPLLDATRRLRAALATAGWGHPRPGMAAWVAPTSVGSASEWAKLEGIGDRRWPALLAAGARLRLNDRAETAALLDKVGAFPPPSPVPSPADRQANAKAQAEVDALASRAPIKQAS